MLSRLIIENFALIESLDIKPINGLNTLTGETGAGKSILLGALNLLLGQRADLKVIKNSEKKFFIEAYINLSSDFESLFDENDLDFELETIVRREISTSGKSRSFINDTPVNLETLQNVMSKIIDIHSQNAQGDLASKSYLYNILDSFSGSKPQLSDYHSEFKSYKSKSSRLETLEQELKNINLEKEFKQFQLNELLEAQLDDLNKEDLEEELSTLENAELIKSKLYSSSNLLSNSESSIVDMLKSVNSELASLESIKDQYAEFYKRVESVIYELEDVSSEISNANEDIFPDQSKKEEIEEILSKLYKLENKHSKNGVDELIKLRDSLDREVASTLELEDEIKSVKDEISTSRQVLLEKGTELSIARRNAADEIKLKLEEILSDLGIAHGNIEFSVTDGAPNELGINQIELLFSANKGVELQPAHKVASGGEISRLIFAIKYVLSDKTNLPVSIFDEIDTGIGGNTAINVGKKLNQLANNRQLVVITHLPQIAKYAQSHFLVTKATNRDDTSTAISLLDKKDKVKEIIKNML